METGTLNERIQIYEPKAERNLTSLDDYELSGTVWANVRAVTTRDRCAAALMYRAVRLPCLFGIYPVFRMTALSGGMTSSTESTIYLQISIKVKSCLAVAIRDLTTIRGLPHDFNQ